MIVARGVGRDTDVVGALVAQGYAREVLELVQLVDGPRRLGERRADDVYRVGIPEAAAAAAVELAAAAAIRLGALRAEDQVRLGATLALAAESVAVADDAARLGDAAAAPSSSALAGGAGGDRLGSTAATTTRRLGKGSA